MVPARTADSRTFKAPQTLSKIPAYQLGSHEKIHIICQSSTYIKCLYWVKKERYRPTRNWPVLFRLPSTLTFSLMWPICSSSSSNTIMLTVVLVCLITWMMYVEFTDCGAAPRASLHACWNHSLCYERYTVGVSLQLSQPRWQWVKVVFNICSQCSSQHYGKFRGKNVVLEDVVVFQDKNLTVNL